MAAPTNVQNLKVRAKAKLEYTLTWDANPVGEGVVAYDIYRSETNYTGFIKVGTTALITIDDHVPVTAPPDLIWWYKIIAVNGSTEESDLNTTEAESIIDEEIFVKNPFDQTIPQVGEIKTPETGNEQAQFTNFQTLPNLSKIEQRWFLEIRKRNKWLLQMGGTKIKLFKRRWSGTKCSKWDPLRKTEDPSPNDTECYGTGFVGGYHNPIEILVSFVNPILKTTRSMEFGFWYDYEPSNWTLWEPNLLDRDLIINTVTGERFEVVNVKKTLWRGIVLRQNFETRHLESTSVIYKLPLI